MHSIDRSMDLSCIRTYLADFYSHTGRPSVDPDLLIRVLLVGYCFGIRSERWLCEDVLETLLQNDIPFPRKCVPARKFVRRWHLLRTDTRHAPRVECATCDGRLSEPRMAVMHVAGNLYYMAKLLRGSDARFVTVMAIKVPYGGHGIVLRELCPGSSIGLDRGLL